MTWLLPNNFRYDSPKKCPTVLYAVILWLTGASHHIQRASLPQTHGLASEIDSIAEAVVLYAKGKGAGL